MSSARKSRWLGALLAALVVLGAPLDGIGPGGHPPPSCRQDSPSRSPSTGWSTRPTSSSRADGRVFVAEKSGIIKVFDNLSDPTPTTFTDLHQRPRLLGPRPARPGARSEPTDRPAVPVRLRPVRLRPHPRRPGAAPRAGATPARAPPGATTDGCVISGRLSRFTVAGATIERHRERPRRGLVPAVPEPLDRRPRLRSGRRALRQRRRRRELQRRRLRAVRRHGRVPTSRTRAATRRRRRDDRRRPPRAARCARRTSGRTGDPAGLDGTIIRVDPVTGVRPRRQPIRGSPDPNARRIIAYGLRNPFRFTFRPGTNELWLGDVGWNDVGGDQPDPDLDDATVENFGWPCYEGSPPAAATTAPT